MTAAKQTFAEWFQASTRIRRASGVRPLSIKAAWAIWSSKKEG
jgi:hypothetical protein